MSDQSGGSSSELGVVSIGAYLAQQRRLRGISAEQLAELTRIPLRSIERLEAGSFDGDLDGFVRGFVRTVAEALGLDPHETLSRTLGEPSAIESKQRRVFGPAWNRLLALAALLALLVGAGVLVRETLRGISPAPSVRPDYVYRRDPVRDLAEAQGPSISLDGEVRASDDAPASGLPAPVAAARPR